MSVSARASVGCFRLTHNYIRAYKTSETPGPNLAFVPTLLGSDGPG